jgi:eukaryotic-like serine/threonine-protein kinase
VISGRYELEELVGTGGMSAVFRAHDRMLDRHVAVKVLHPHHLDDDEYVERFKREARAVAQLSHPNIVTVIDRGDADGNQYIVFENVAGETLKDLVRRTGPLPVRRAAELGAAIADGLAFAHENGLVHRDVKPQNVLLTDAGEPKLTDFGIARSLDVDGSVTQTGTVLGTSNYLSPEQANGEPVTAASDVYSLGIVVYELLTGDVPFPGDNAVAVALKHVHDEPPSLLEQRPDVPLRLVAAVERALEKDPARRFPSMEAFARELRSSVGDEVPFDAERTFVQPGSVLRQSGRHRVRAGWSPRPFLFAGLALLAAAAVLAGIYALGGSRTPRRTGGVRGAAATPVTLHGVGNYDPSGGHADTHADTAADATDGDASTYWETQIYASPEFGGLKQGLGLVLDAGHAVKLKTITVDSTTPGFTAQILASHSPDSPVETVGSQTTFTLEGKTSQTYVLWITRLPPGGTAHVTEVSAH